jgi:hypothetical protein
MLGTFTIEMQSEHALVIAIALDTYIANTEHAQLFAVHDVEGDEQEGLEIARWMKGQLTMMFYEQAKQALRNGREEMSDSMIELLEQVVNDVERGGL